MICPSCQTPNKPTFKFCQSCGQPLQTAAQEIAKQPVEQPVEPRIYMPAPEDRPLARVETPQPLTTTPSRQIEKAPSDRSLNHSPASNPVYNAAQMSIFNIWGPFAGYGTRRRHLGWLMDDQGQHAGNLIKRVGARFQERAIPHAGITQRTLTARGVRVEKRRQNPSPLSVGL